MFEHCLYFNINTLTRIINQRWAEVYATIDLSPAHAYLLRLVLSEPGITQKQLAAELRLAPSTITRFIDALSVHGLLQRLDTAGDAREWAIHPTAPALALRNELELICATLTQELRDTLGAASYGELVSMLREAQETLHNATRRQKEHV